MAGEPSAAVAPGLQGDDAGAADMKPVFRAVLSRGERRGIRLEAIFWKTLAAMSSSRAQTLGEIVAKAADEVPETGNLASTLRVLAARWVSGRVMELERLTSTDSVFAIVHASPSPAFVLTVDRRIVQYNQAFLNFLQARLAAADGSDPMRTVRLALDTHVEQVIEQLTADPKLPVTTGFALGVAERRVRGQLRLALAPVHSSTMVIAYITHT
jgi:predicted DNA-binding ribbon-helix-helix protein